MIKRNILTASAAFLLTVGIVTAPVLAHEGVDTSGRGSSSTETTTNSSNTRNTASTDSSNSISSQDASNHDQKIKVENEADEIEQHAQEDSLHSEAAKELLSIGKNREKHSDEVRKKNCDAAEHGLETKLQNLAKNATAFQTKIDTALELAIAYQKDNAISVDGFDALVTAAHTAQTISATSVTVLNGLSPDLDCTQKTVASNVAEFKVAARQAKTDLSAYKQAVKAVLKSLETAKEAN